MSQQRFLVRAGKAPNMALTPEASFARARVGAFAMNTGNLLFTNAVQSHLASPDTTVTPDSLTSERGGVTEEHIERINEEYDAFVVPLANAFRESFIPSLDKLERTIRGLSIPVIVTGVGAQTGAGGSFDGQPPKVREHTKTFVRAVLDRSASIGVRGEITKRYLVELGFPAGDIDVIGCPSMFDPHRAQTVRPTPSTIGSDARLAVSFTPGKAWQAEMLEHHLAAYQNATLVPQEHKELGLLLWGRPIPGYPAGLPADPAHIAYRDDRIRMFLDPAPWYEFMKTQDFAFGARIHGTVAALNAGTPAVVLAHDSRTLELAEYHGIPYRRLSEFTSVPDAADLAASADFGDYHRVGPENLARYRAFLRRNGLPYADANAENAVDASALPGPVGPIGSAPQDELVSRLRWLWQGVAADQERPTDAYSAPFAPAGTAPETERARAIRAEQQLRETTKRLERADRDLAASIAELERAVSAHRETLDYLGRPVEHRLWNAVKHRVSRALRRG